MVCVVDRFYQRHCGDRGLGSYHTPCKPIHGRLFNTQRPDDWRVFRFGRVVVLRVLRGYFDPDVPNHWNLGWAEQNLRGVQVLLVHLAGLLVDVGCLDIFVHQIWW